MTITEVSKKFDIPADTIRYYERIGLLPPVKRNSSGNRDFSEEDCNWVYYIKMMRSAGISIESLIDYVRMFQEGISTISARKQILAEQYNVIEEKISKLQAVQSRLKQKIDGYEERILKYEEEKLRNRK